jgi:hypothetical protein
MAGADNMKAANRTYGSFIALVKWAVPIVAVVALIVIILISS